ncbi:MAG: DsbA family protein [Bdellovibrionota bacterium]
MSALRKYLNTPLLVGMAAVAMVIAFACTGNGNAKEKPKYTFKEGQGPAGAVASIDGKPVSEDELMGEEKLEFVEALRKIYDLRMSRIGRLLLERSYSEEAKKANLGLDEYVETKVLKGDAKISDSEYNKFVQEKKIPKEQLNPQLKERILTYMKAQKKQEELEKLIVSLSKKHKVEIYFAKPNVKVNIDIGQAPTFGGKDAKVKIVEFSDFQCPFCSRGANTVNELKKIYGNKIQVAFKHFPLPMHPQAKPASEASMCVNEQNTDKYWKYHDKLFANQDKLDNENLKKYAKEVGADMEKFNKCFEEKKYAKLVQDDLEYGSKLGVRSTPTFFINGRPVAGALPVENFREAIDEELAGG